MGVTLEGDLARLGADLLVEDLEDAPPADATVAPQTLEEAARVLDLASERRAEVLVWGGGTHQGLGARPHPDIVLSTHRLDKIVDWRPDDLTVVAEAGVRVADLEQVLASRNQSAVLPELPGRATVGGVVASASSGWRRLRYGPTRDRVLEVALVAGDGRIVTGGGRVVKNVTGYDLPRLATGSLGSLGLIGRVALKLWPAPVASATVTVPDAAEALRRAYRPLAVIEDDGTARAYLGGAPSEVEVQIRDLDGDGREGLHWPAPINQPVRFSLRVPPRLVGEAIARLPSEWHYQAAFGVGEIRVGAPSFDTAGASDLRDWAEGHGGALVVEAAPAPSYALFDPWGTPPATLDVQRRLVARFDPVRVVNPGRLPGGL